MKVNFNEADHSYTCTDTKRQYISVTQLIGKYVPEFDSNYWSLYKAVKDVLSNHNCFDTYKRSVGGWTNVVDSWRKTPLTRFQQEVCRQQENYLLKWSLISETACTIGTAEHKRRELDVACNDYYLHNNEQFETPKIHSQKDILAIQDFTTNRVYTELLVYNDEFMVAGQVDWVLKKGKHVHIKDYKTSEEITKEAFNNQKLLTPLNELPNANWFIYALQLSTYGWILEQCGYVVDKLEIIHTRSEKSIVMPYLKHNVQRMMRDYAEF